MEGSVNYQLDFSGKLPVSAQVGMKQADDNASPEWKHVFDACVLAAARKHRELTSDSVLAEMESLPHPPQTHNLGAIGSAMRRACAARILTRTDRVKRSERPEKHGNRQNIYVSNYFQG
jgi:hypothetical protein